MAMQVALRTKLILAFLAVAGILLLVGVISVVSIQRLEAATDKTAETAPLIDAAMEMKVSLAREMQMIMEMLAAEDGPALEAVRAERNGFVAVFDRNAALILDGGELDGKTFHAATDKDLRKIVLEAKKQHDEVFSSKVESIFEKRKRTFPLAEKRKHDMELAEKHVAAILKTSHELEKRAKALVEKRLVAGDPAAEILHTENTWADVAMELRTIAALSRISFDAFARAHTDEAQHRHAKEFYEHVKEFDAFLEALREGGEIEEMRIKAVTDTEARALVEQLAVAMDQGVKPAFEDFVKLQQRHTTLAREVAALDEAADTVGEQTLAKITGIEERAGELIDAVLKNAHGTAKTGTLVTEVFAVLGLLIALGLGYFLSGSISRPLRRLMESLSGSARETAAASGQISEASQGLAEGATEQAASLEESSAALEQMASMARKNSDNADVADKEMSEASTLLNEGATAVRDMAGAMGEISDSSEKIGAIIKTIEEIAFQTNLLALNAAVEAARAGDAGKGFAVVADEVRNLAQRAGQAARDTAELIQTSMDRVRNGSSIAGRLQESFQQVETASDKVARLIGEIANASKEQAQGVDQVNTAVAQMDKVTQQNAANAEESASASEELNAQAEALQGMVDELALLVEGARTRDSRGGPGAGARYASAAGPRAGYAGAGAARCVAALPSRPDAAHALPYHEG